MLGNVNTSSALSAFEKMEEKGKEMKYLVEHRLSFRCSFFIVLRFLSICYLWIDDLLLGFFLVMFDYLPQNLGSFGNGVSSRSSWTVNC